MGMLTSGAERSRRFGGSDTRATQMLPCSDVACGRAALRCQDTCPSAARPPPGTLPDHLPAISRRTQTAETLQLFYLKEKKKKKYPNTQRTKPIANRNSGSLCLLSVLCGGFCVLLGPWRPSPLHGSPAPAQTSG